MVKSFHKSNMSSWGAPKCPKFIAKKYLRFTYIFVNWDYHDVNDWRTSQNHQANLRCWTSWHWFWCNLRSKSNPKEIHHKQMQTPDLCSMNLCQSMWVQSWKRCCFLQAQSVPKNQTVHSSENIPYLQYGSPKRTNPVYPLNISKSVYPEI